MDNLYEGIRRYHEYLAQKFDEPFDKARPLTDSKRPLYGYYWTDDAKYILYVKDKDGDENINIFAVSPYEKVENGKLPESRNLTPFKDIAAQIYATSQKSGCNHDRYQ